VFFILIVLATNVYAQNNTYIPAVANGTVPNEPEMPVSISAGAGAVFVNVGAGPGTELFPFNTVQRSIHMRVILYDGTGSNYAEVFLKRGRDTILTVGSNSLMIRVMPDGSVRAFQHTGTVTWQLAVDALWL
jgi:hypothetical protein